MFYYIKEINSDSSYDRTAGVKARRDLETIFSAEHFSEIRIPSIFNRENNASVFRKLQIHRRVSGLWRDATKGVAQGDTLLIQFPAVEHSLFLFSVIKEIVKRGAKVVLILHDLELARYSLRKDLPLATIIRLFFEEKTVLNNVSSIVVHNENMKKLLVDKTGVSPDNLITLTIFDYLVAPDMENVYNDSFRVDKPVVICGNLDPAKARYAYDLPDGVPFNLYGVNYCGEPGKDIVYHGSYTPEELPFSMDGSFGLVWDGESPETCEGTFGDYLRVNDPHKASLYLASGLPVMIWEEAALAEYVLEKDVGITIKSLYEIPSVLEKMTKERYQQLKSNALDLAHTLRNGANTKRVIAELTGQSKGV